MKISRLPDTDLARIAPLSVDDQIKQLRVLRDKEIRMSYQQLRSTFPELFNMGSDLLGSSEPTLWKHIEKRLVKKCRKGIETTANIRAAKSLHKFALESEIYSREEKFSALRLGIQQEVRFWHPMIIMIDGNPYVPFIDPRTSNSLSPDGRTFAFSMMHEHIRVTNPDFSAVGLAIFQLSKPVQNIETGEKVRHTRAYFGETHELLSMADLEALAARTYDLWAEVLAETKTAPAPLPATGTTGTLL